MNSTLKDSANGDGQQQESRETQNKEAKHVHPGRHEEGWTRENMKI